MKIKPIITTLILFQGLSLLIGEVSITVDKLMSAWDANLYAKSRVLTSKMIVHGRRSSRTIHYAIGLWELTKPSPNIFHHHEKLEQKC